MNRSRLWLHRAQGFYFCVLVVTLGGCVSATVDEMTYNEPVAGIGESSVVILGRRHAPDYDTEFDFMARHTIHPTRPCASRRALLSRVRLAIYWGRNRDSFFAFPFLRLYEAVTVSRPFLHSSQRNKKPSQAFWLPTFHP